MVNGRLFPDLAVEAFVAQHLEGDGLKILGGTHPRELRVRDGLTWMAYQRHDLPNACNTARDAITLPGRHPQIFVFHHHNSLWEQGYPSAVRDDKRRIGGNG